MEKKNVFTALICACVFAYFGYECDELMDAGAYWPRLICITGLGLSLLQVLIEGLKWLVKKRQPEKLNPFTAVQWKRILFLLAVMILWLVGLQSLGFLTSSVVATALIAVVYDPHKTTGKMVLDIGCCALFCTVCYVLFKYLGIMFPNTPLF